MQKSEGDDGAYLAGVSKHGWFRWVGALMGAVGAGGGVFPDVDAVPGVGGLKSVLGGLLTVVLVTAVLMLVVCAAGWAVSSSRGNVQAAMRARVGVGVSVATAAVAGAGQVWLTFLIEAGSRL